MSNDFTFRYYESGDEEQIVPLLALVFGRWPQLRLDCSDMDYWIWKFIDRPISGFSMLSLDKEKIIGCLHSVPLKIKVEDSLLAGTTMTDLAVHPDYRKMGIMNQMLQHNVARLPKKGIKMNYAITGNPIVIKNMEKRFNRLPFPVVNLVSIKDIDTHLKEMPVDNPLLMKTGFQIVKNVSSISGSLKKTPISENIEITETETFGPEVDQFWMKTAPSFDFIVERKRDYLNWRYCDPRSGDYTVKMALQDGELVGYSVLGLNRLIEHYPVGYIMDILVLPGREDVINMLAQDAVHHFESLNVNIVNYQVIKGSIYGEALKKHGFLDSRINLHIFINTYEKQDLLKITQSLSPDKVYISWGDHDVLPVKMPGS